ncbi:MAG TPA: glycosyltransferase family 39 protein [Anaerolinea sp.]|nr:glycosyltransferase family 39 protein [Anaerolinea sp.]
MRARANRWPWAAMLAALSLVGLAFYALAPAAPSLTQIPNIDYSIFQYVGERIREGQLPYRDVFDHKPPLIFYLDALGLTLGGGSRWGIWALQLIAVGSAGLLGYAALKRVFGRFPAWLAAAGFLLNLVFVHEGGNLTEEFALPFQFAAVYLLADMEAARRSGWRTFGMGLALGMASTLKQPLAGPLAAILVILLAWRIGRRGGVAVADFAWLAVGFGLVWHAGSPFSRRAVRWQSSGTRLLYTTSR